jgi:hypothetical protein
MAEDTNRPARIQGGSPDDGRQLGLLLVSSREELNQELRRTERLENKARNALTSAGALFAVVMATTAGILNVILQHKTLPWWVYLALGLCAVASIVALGFAVWRTSKADELKLTGVLSVDSLKDYVGWAEDGHPAIAKKLIEANIGTLDRRRTRNDERAKHVQCARTACLVAAGASLLQLFGVFVALMVAH